MFDQSADGGDLRHGHADLYSQSGFWSDLSVEYRSNESDHYGKRSRHLYGHSDYHGRLFEHVHSNTDNKELQSMRDAHDRLLV